MSNTAKKLRKKAKRLVKDRERTRKQQAEFGEARSILQTIGIWEGLKQARIDLDHLLRKRPKLMVRKAPGSSDSLMSTKVVDALQSALDNADIQLRGGYTVSLRLFWTRLLPALSALHISIQTQPQLRDLGRRLRPAIESLIPKTNEFWDEVGEICGKVISHYCRFDDVIYFVQLDNDPHAGDSLPPHLSVHERKARPKKVVINGSCRTGYWCGMPEHGEVRWLTWNGKLLDPRYNDKTYPVLVQRHVLERLYGRSKRLSLEPEAIPFLHCELYRSLKEPVFHAYPRNSNGFLVEYRLSDIKIGYLLGHLLDQDVLIDTFLFLTMDGTPEGTELWKHLRLSRHDKEYLGLDDIATFAITDLRNDKYLVSLLNKCGCGQVFDLFHPLKDPIAGYADALKAYIGMAKPPGSGVRSG